MALLKWHVLVTSHLNADNFAILSILYNLEA